MEVTGGEEEGYVREWAPCTHMLSLIPPKVQSGLFSNELSITCLDAVTEYIALGTNVGLVYWYDRKKGTVQRLRCETSASPITYVKIVNTVDYMVGAGSAAGQVTVFQIPKEHPDNIPENLKPKVEPKVERYTIGDLHKSQITAIEWSKNGMKLFSGDKNGIIIMSEIDFYMHLCKSMEIVNEQHEIVQLSYQKGALLVSSVYRSIVCERREQAWQCTQLGKKERHFLCKLGGVLVHSWSCGAAPRAYCARAGLRLWRADAAGQVLQTLLFKDAISNPLTIVELLNPAQKRHSHADKEYNFGPIHVLREHFLVTYNEDILYILDPRSLTAVAVVDNLRRILSVSVNKDEIFILEGPRSVIRLAHAPEIGVYTKADEPIGLMTKSLTSSFHQAVNTVRDFTHIDQTVPFITSVLEQPISMLTKNEVLENSGNVAKAEECFELPPIKQLPSDVSKNVLQSIINEFKDVSSETEELRRVKSEELQKKLKIFNSIMERKYEGELIHSSRRSKRKELGSAHSSPRNLTPVRQPELASGDVAYTSPCVMDCSYIENQSEADELLEKQIEEKEKILAKMLNLESLSIKTKPLHNIVKSDDKTVQNNLFDEEKPAQKNKTVQSNLFDEVDNEKPAHKKKPEDEVDNKKPAQITKPEVITKKPVNKSVEPDLLPKMVKLPNNWILEDLKLDLSSKRHYGSPENNSDSEWEMV